MIRKPPRPVPTTPLVTPLMPSVVYTSEGLDALDAIYKTGTGFTYAREGHPNASHLAQMIDHLEGAQDGTVVSSGMAAVSAALIGACQAGDHIIGSQELYGRSLRLLNEDLPRLGIETSLADTTDVNAVAQALKPNTKAILVEVVANPTLRIADMVGLRGLCQEHGILLIVDNTFTTPRGFAAHTFGADITLHSVTKLLAGHSDATLGYVVARNQDLNTAIRTVAVTWGMTASPFDCWMAERGLMTFAMRYDRAEQTAGLLADALADLKPVTSVLYPGRKDHPDKARAEALLGTSFGNMVTFTLDGGRDLANAFVRTIDLAFAPTLGDVSTTMSNPETSSHRALSPEQRASLGLYPATFRISVGMEEPDALCDTFTQAILAIAG